MVRCLHISSTDSFEGAARASYRLHQLLKESPGVTSRMLVRRKQSDDDTVLSYTMRQVGYWRAKQDSFRHRMDARNWVGFASQNSGLHSRADQDSGMLEAINAIEHDVVNLHWLGSDSLTIEEVGLLSKPVVWTFHDMWPFCGGEHYTPEEGLARYEAGYHAGNRTPGESGPDMNRWIWQRKKSAWKKPISVVCPSQWMADCARRSQLFCESQIHMIPNPLNLDLWKPSSRENARTLLGLPQDRRIILFGAIGGDSSLRKGGDLLREALGKLDRSSADGYHMVVFGQSESKRGTDLDFPITYLGRLYDDYSMAAAYNAADVMIVPSRQDNLPQTAVEAQSCGVPVVAFDVGGLSEIITHKETGYLAKPYDTEELSKGISWVLAESDRLSTMCSNARRLAEEKYNPQSIAAAYADIYSQLSGCDGSPR